MLPSRSRRAPSGCFAFREPHNAGRSGPVSPGRNVTTVIEVAARNHLLKQRGLYSSKAFQERLNQELLKNSEEDGEVPE